MRVAEVVGLEGVGGEVSGLIRVWISVEKFFKGWMLEDRRGKNPHPCKSGKSAAPGVTAQVPYHGFASAISALQVQSNPMLTFATLYASLAQSTIR